MTMKKIFPWLIASAAILRNGSQLISIFCAKPHLCNLHRSIRRQGRKKILGIAGHHRIVLFSRSMVVL